MVETFGHGLLIVLFVLWVMGHMRRLYRTDQAITRFALLGFAVHAYTDNLLIATNSYVFLRSLSQPSRGKQLITKPRVGGFYTSPTTCLIAKR